MGLFNIFGNQTLDYIPTSSFYTPNGTELVVVDRDYELSDEEIQQNNNYIGMICPSAIRLSDSSRLFNCHSYAWLSQEEGNNYWLDDPSSFYLDGSYDEVYMPQIGDIICYFDDNGTNNHEDDINIHSGIVTGFSNEESNYVCGISNTLVVTSKWGEYGLYEHLGDDCIYTSTYGGTADYIRFFRYHIHSYSYIDNGELHAKFCECGYQIEEQHRGLGRCRLCGHAHTHSFDTWQYLNHRVHIEACICGHGGILTENHIVRSTDIVNNRANCLECGYLLDLSIDFAIGYYSSNNIITNNGSFRTVTGIIVLVDEDIPLYESGKLCI